MRTALAATAASIFAGGAGAQNLVINGDFENNTAVTSRFNLSNANFSAFMSDTTAFGTAGELDIVTGLDLGIAPQSGNWKVGMHEGPSILGPDAFSMTLSGPVAAGKTCSLRFFGAGTPGGPPLGPIEVGLSKNPATFGVQVFSGAPLGTSSWTELNSIFIAPVDGTYLTFRTSDAIPGMYAFIDNVSLTVIPAPAPALPFAGLLCLVRRRRAAPTVPPTTRPTAAMPLPILSA